MAHEIPRAKDRKTTVKKDSFCSDSIRFGFYFDQTQFRLYISSVINQTFR